VSAVITDLGVLEPNPASCELVLRQVHPGVEVVDVVAATGWPLQVAEQVEVSPAPTEAELTALRALRTAEEP
jgi:acyl CoA:acetate/3-ketoacid CoA transferase beta subunit